MAGRLTSSFTALAMLLHAVFGCCAHHAHADEHEAAQALCVHTDHTLAHSDGKSGDDEHHVCGHRHEKAVGESDSSNEATATCCGHNHSQCPHHQCADKCRFVKTLVTETPRPADAGFVNCNFCSTADLALDRLQSLAARIAVDTGPPDRCCADLCAAPVTQVWRL